MSEALSLGAVPRPQLRHHRWPIQIQPPRGHTRSRPGRHGWAGGFRPPLRLETEGETMSLRGAVPNFYWMLFVVFTAVHYYTKAQGTPKDRQAPIR